jgi:hypothetical protein
MFNETPFTQTAQVLPLITILPVITECSGSEIEGGRIDGETKISDRTYEESSGGGSRG